MPERKLADTPRAPATVAAVAPSTPMAEVSASSSVSSDSTLAFASQFLSRSSIACSRRCHLTSESSSSDARSASAASALRETAARRMAAGSIRLTDCRDGKALQSRAQGGGL